MGRSLKDLIEKVPLKGSVITVPYLLLQGFFEGDHLDEPAFTLAKGYIVSHDLVFNRILEWCGFDYSNFFPFDKSHFGDPFPESPTTTDLDNNTSLALLKVL